jgi:hypothetical protein
MHSLVKTAAADRNTLAATTPLNNKHGHWWNDRGLRTLNFLLFIPLMSEYVQGYDASLINNVQQLTVWQKGTKWIMELKFNKLIDVQSFIIPKEAFLVF